MRCKGMARSSSGHGGDITGGAELSGSMGTTAREGNRARGERGSAFLLTASAGGAEAGSGKGWSRRGVGGDLGHPREEEEVGDDAPRAFRLLGLAETT